MYSNVPVAEVCWSSLERVRHPLPKPSTPRVWTCDHEKPARWPFLASTAIHGVILEARLQYCDAPVRAWIFHLREAARSHRASGFISRWEIPNFPFHLRSRFRTRDHECNPVLTEIVQPLLMNGWIYWSCTRPTKAVADHKAESIAETDISNRFVFYEGEGGKVWMVQLATGKMVMMMTPTNVVLYTVRDLKVTPVLE